MFERVCAALLVMVAACCMAAAAPEAASKATTLVAVRETRTEAAAEVVRAAGGTLTVFVPEAQIGLARLDEQGLAALRTDARVLAAGRPLLTTAELRRLEGPARLAAGAWQRMQLFKTSPGYRPSTGSPLIEDALKPPVWWQDIPPPEDGAVVAAMSPGPRPYGASAHNTSEYLAGRISLNLMFVESTAQGGSAEDWDSTKEGQVLAEAMSAADSVVALYPTAGLVFTIHPLYGRTDSRIRVSCEPIANRADPNDETTGVREDTWVKEILGKLGYSSGNRFYRSRMQADATRMTDQTDWAFNVFVVNSYKDADGRFSDSWFAYAYIGGPHAVVTYDNDGWGISSFDAVLRHELHHVFFVLDEYGSSGCTCDERAGYLNGANDNCENSCGAIVTCVMRNNAAASCPATHKQAGTLDTDADGTPDILEAPPTISVIDQDGPDCDGDFSVTGAAVVGLHPNENPAGYTPQNDISILTVAAVEHRIDQGPWQVTATSADGAFDAAEENYLLDLSLEAGDHTIDLRTRDVRGNTSTPISLDVSVGSSPAPVGDTLSLTRSGSLVVLAWDPAVGATSYEVHRSLAPASVLTGPPVATPTATTWSDADAGAVWFYNVVSASGCGWP